ncbi:DUF6898 family protein [Chenggangzhangella methanolivorans]|uniref:DUF6898 domain-containing protein n=1 Tax=Chenggangzhangella methanolivorans TaxID=1437009 RepID=A0A9E6RCX2_9HYPH|nr:hypothetical protein [Chenggangzhangella methanolivorans]QZO02564.1 hypothetical protein K6K41_27035 [Chenggangzhangella methanolivorans]
MTPRRPFGRPSNSPGVDAVAPGEVLFEFITRGNATRCAAIDAATGVEVVVVGPPSAVETQLKAVALRKLRMRLAKG